ncbi:uncharacterized protein CTRU02_204393 [Colletotrichum truncatum]|uniref:Uncharacterized protein n=1 Tax=Colletotrichum truncatum TaxID=5467 RepID=A0ACC3ZBZ3_COLTU|nr:uncharacterized protein CTRU02_13114 [Colletotrichum truncatum]KAF6783864.1 hypothetical protein CTRU02_13114 [Colletotrichum truncatum]
MKAIMVLSPIILATSALGSQLDAPTGWEKIPKDKPLPLHTAPICWQECLQWENKNYVGNDINTVSQYDFCEDKFLAMRTWHHFWLTRCTSRNCHDRADHEKARTWFSSVCRRG